MMKTVEPLVSVIINCYNSERFISTAIESVINQTYSKWELIIWDNQSNDGSRQIVESYKDSRIKYYYAPEHTPLGAARNLALEKASGDYIGFLDSDDKWLPLFLSECVKSISDNPDVVLVYSNYFCQEGDKLWLAYKKEKTGLVDTRKFVKKYNIAISAALFKSVIINSENIRFNTRFSLIEDYDFYIKLGLFGKIAYISEPLMVYLYHENNLSHSTKWIDEFKLLLRCMDEGTGLYHEVAVFRAQIQKRANYVEANYYAFSGQRRKALSIILKNIIFSPSYAVLLLKVLVGPETIRKIHIQKQGV